MSVLKRLWSSFGEDYVRGVLFFPFELAMSKVVYTDLIISRDEDCGDLVFEERVFDVSETDYILIL